MDSGADESVTPPGVFATEVVPSAMSEAGLSYSGAGGEKIPALGQTKVPFATTEGHHCSLLFQVARITRPLISVAQLSRSGHRCVLENDGGFIEHRSTGRTIKLERTGDTYVLRVLVRDATETAPVFSRHGR